MSATESFKRRDWCGDSVVATTMRHKPLVWWRVIESPPARFLTHVSMELRSASLQPPFASFLSTSTTLVSISLQLHHNTADLNISSLARALSTNKSITELKLRSLDKVSPGDLQLVGELICTNHNITALGLETIYHLYDARPLLVDVMPLCLRNADIQHVGGYGHTKPPRSAHAGSIVAENARTHY